MPDLAQDIRSFIREFSPGLSSQVDIDLMIAARLYCFGATILVRMGYDLEALVVHSWSEQISVHALDVMEVERILTTEDAI